MPGKRCRIVKRASSKLFVARRQGAWPQPRKSRMGPNSFAPMRPQGLSATPLLLTVAPAYGCDVPRLRANDSEAQRYTKGRVLVGGVRLNLLSAHHDWVAGAVRRFAGGGGHARDGAWQGVARR